MPEADADQRPARGMDGADEFLQRLDPGVILVNAVLGAGDQPAVAFLGALRQLPAFDVVADEFKAVPVQQAGEHVIVIAMRLVNIVGCVASHQDADFHSSPII